MNIFYTHETPKLCAQALDDLRLNKMIIESCQMLNLTLQTLGVPEEEWCNKVDGTKYLRTRRHLNHPCTKWTMSSRKHYEWLLEHTNELAKEFKYRHGREHCFHKLGNYKIFKSKAHLLEDKPFQQPPGAFDKRYKEWFGKTGSLIQDYQNYLTWKWMRKDIIHQVIDKKQSRYKWTKRNAPMYYLMDLRDLFDLAVHQLISEYPGHESKLRKLLGWG